MAEIINFTRKSARASWLEAGEVGGVYFEVYPEGAKIRDIAHDLSLALANPKTSSLAISVRIGKKLVLIRHAQLSYYTVEQVRDFLIAQFVPEMPIPQPTGWLNKMRQRMDLGRDITAIVLGLRI